MKSFLKLSNDNKILVLRLIQTLIKKPYNEFERMVSEEDFDKDRVEKKLYVKKMLKHIKDNNIR